MIIFPGQTGVTINFTYTVGGVLQDADTATATLLRNGIDTVVPVVVSSSVPGRYQAQFDIPPSWQGYDRVDVRFEAQTAGMPIECTKPVAVIAAAGMDDGLDADVTRIVDLLEADELLRDGVAYKLLAGTSTVLLQKNVEGTTCVDEVSLTE